METVSRYGKLTAKPGRGDELAAILLKAADDLAGDPGCLLYMVNRQKDAPDTIWVTELWRGQAELDAVLARIRESGQTAATMDVVQGGEMVELELLGGKGAHPA